MQKYINSGAQVGKRGELMQICTIAFHEGEICLALKEEV